jgi:hypothetical protein
VRSRVLEQNILLQKCINSIARLEENCRDLAISTNIELINIAENFNLK